MKKYLKTYKQLFKKTQSDYEYVLDLFANDDVKNLKKYINNGGQLEFEDKKPLLFMLAFNYTHNFKVAQIAQILIDAGIDVNAATILNTTPLSWAIIEDEYDLFKVILNSKDVDVNKYNKRRQTPLYKTASLNNGSYKYICDLTDAGADWFIKDFRGHYFLDILANDVKIKLKERYPEKYNRYLSLKKANDFNL